MLRRALIAVSALATTVAPVAGQATQPLAPRFASPIEKSSEGLISPMWAALLAMTAVIAGALILGDDDDEPVSP